MLCASVTAVEVAVTAQGPCSKLTTVTHARLEASDVCPCHMHACPAVPSNSVLTVNCSRPSGGWPPARWNLTVRAVSASAGCTANNSFVTAVTTNQPPVVSRSGSTSINTVCALDRNVSLPYTLISGGGANTTYNLSASPSSLNCTASPVSATGGVF